MPDNEITLTTIYEILQDHTGILQDHTRTLQDHTRTLQEHSRMMQEHSRILQDHTGLLQDHTGRLDRLDHIESVQNKMALRLIDVEVTVKENNSMLRSMRLRLDSLHGLVEELERRSGRIEQEYVMITEALRRLEERFDRIEAERLRERIAALEARVQALETAET
jgi:chromosome segregation ATPase